MKAWVLRKQGNIEERPLEFVSLPEPFPKDNEIRVRITHCGLCRTDLHIAEGDLPLKKTPIILGHEIVGIVDGVGERVKKFKIGDRVGVTWLNSTCKRCKYCLSGKENYCPEFKSTGWDMDGGFAEYTVIKENFALPLNNIKMESSDTAPLMCPGVAGYSAFKLANVKKGDKLGIFGFGPTAYYILRVANFFGIDVYVSTRSFFHIEKAKKSGAIWSGNAMKERIPKKLNSIIIFPPAGELVEKSLSYLEKDGVLVLAAVSMSPIVIDNYTKNLWGKTIRTLYNVNMKDAKEFLGIVNRLDLGMDVEIFPFEKLQDALILMKSGKIKGMNAVISV